jgi:hypothetical protein
LHIVFRQLLGVDLCIKVVAVRGSPILEVIGCEMLASGYNLLEFRVRTAFEAADERSNIALQVVRVLAWSFLPTAPSGISVASRSALGRGTQIV